MDAFELIFVSLDPLSWKLFALFYLDVLTCGFGRYELGGSE